MNALVALEMIGNVGAIVLTVWYVIVLVGQRGWPSALLFAAAVIVAAMLFIGILIARMYEASKVKGSSPSRTMVKAIGMLAIPTLLAKAFGAW